MSKSSPLVSWGVQTAETESDLSLSVGKTGVTMLDEGMGRLMDYALIINGYLEDPVAGTIKLDSTDKFKELLNEMIVFSKSYFRFEENLIKKNFLPWLAFHKEEHQKILNLLNDNSKNVAAGQLYVTPDFQIQLLESLINHVNKADCPSFNQKYRSKALLNLKSSEELLVFVPSTGISPVDQNIKTFCKSLTQVSSYFQYYENKSPNEKEWFQIQTFFNNFYHNIRAHFDFQEKFIKKIGLPGYLAHKKDHWVFLNSISNFCRKIAARQAVFSSNIHLGTLNWWLTHFKEEDCKLFNSKKVFQCALEESNVWNDLEWMFADFEDNSIQLKLVIQEFLKAIPLILNKEGSEKISNPFKSALESLKKMFKEEESSDQRLKCSIPHKIEHRNIENQIQEVIESIETNRVGLNHLLVEDTLSSLVFHYNRSDFRDYQLFKNLSFEEIQP